MHGWFWLTVLVLLPAPMLAQSVPSQYELNGFLLGQHISPIRHQLGEPSQEQRTDDHWVYRVYVIDRAHHAYMVFKFAPDRPDYAVSIQIAGDSGTQMYPFLSLVLGSDTGHARARFGKATAIEQEFDPPLSAWSYASRNYSFEFTPAGRLYSIQIFGYDGFDAMPPEPLARLEPLRDALVSHDPERLLSVVASDLEVYRGGRSVTFTSSARRELADSTTSLSQLLYVGPNSLRALLADAPLVQRGTVAIRVYEHPRPASIYTSFRFPAGTPLEELVFQGFAGQWRLWEVRFR